VVIGSISTVYQLICIMALGGRYGIAMMHTAALIFLEDAIVPMCQSPRIADVFLKAGQAPANDNGASLKARMKSPAPRSAFPATWLIVSIFGCLTAFWLL
jgi:hypothetical protein